MKLRNLIAIGTATAAVFALLALAAPIGRAQSTFEVPAPAQQNPQNFAPPSGPAPPPFVLAPPREGEPIQLLPQAMPMQAAPPPAPAPPPPAPIRAPITAQTAPVLPEVFRGCWQGRVDDLDWIHREPGGHKVGFWTPKTYRLCYQRVGAGPFRLTFTETGVDPSEKIINPRGHVTPLATDGRDYARLRSTLHFDEYPARRESDAATFAVDETTNLDCRIVGSAMNVSADVFGTRDGAPWFRAHWRARFRQAGE